MPMHLSPWPMIGKNVRKDMKPGQRFGLVTFVRFTTSMHGARCLVRCDCGVERIVKACNLRKTPPETHRSCRLEEKRRRDG